MNKDDVEAIMTKFPTFRGFFWTNELPEVKEYPSGYLIGIWSKERNDGHGVGAFFHSRHYCEYFDSHGLPPVNNKLIKWLSKYASVIRHSAVPLQDRHPATEGACGPFSIVFLALKDREETLEQILAYFSKDKACNDQIAKVMTRIFNRPEYKVKEDKVELQLNPLFKRLFS